MERIGRILPRAVQSHGIQEQVHAMRVLDEVRAWYDNHWGPEKAPFVEIVSFQKGTLRIRVTSSAGRQEAKLQQVKMQNAVNHAIGQKVITSVQFLP